MIIGQYRIIEKIGQGGMGVIYKAEHTTLEQIVAIKALPSSLGSNTDIRERFIREARIQAKLSHPNVVNILNFLEHEGNNYIVMEYVDGETLESIIKTTGLIPPDRCVALLRQVLDGIGYAHSQGVIHRDIKPSNIMITRQGTVKITDFGIAKIAGDLRHTQTGVKVGTLWYMSPEQVQGQQAGVTSDIYALGITLFEMVTGKVPFTGDSEYHIMHNIVQNPPPDPREFYPYIPLSLEQTILKAIAKSPQDRFQNVREFIESLEREDVGAVASAEPRVTAPVSPPVSAPANTIAKDRRLLWALAGAASLAVVAVAVIVFLSASGKNAQAKKSEPVRPLPPRIVTTNEISREPAPVTSGKQEPVVNGTAHAMKDEQQDDPQENGRTVRKPFKKPEKKKPEKKNLASQLNGGKRTRNHPTVIYNHEATGDSNAAADKALVEAQKVLRGSGKLMPKGSFTEGFSPGR